VYDHLRGIVLIVPRIRQRELLLHVRCVISGGDLRGSHDFRAGQRVDVSESVAAALPVQAQSGANVPRKLMVQAQAPVLVKRRFQALVRKV
jgi:hypothetical protein